MSGVENANYNGFDLGSTSISPKKSISQVDLLLGNRVSLFLSVREHMTGEEQFASFSMHLGIQILFMVSLLLSGLSGFQEWYMTIGMIIAANKLPTVCSTQASNQVKPNSFKDWRLTPSWKMMRREGGKKQYKNNHKINVLEAGIKSFKAQENSSRSLQRAENILNIKIEVAIESENFELKSSQRLKGLLAGWHAEFLRYFMPFLALNSSMKNFSLIQQMETPKNIKSVKRSQFEGTDSAFLQYSMDNCFKSFKVFSECYQQIVELMWFPNSFYYIQYPDTQNWTFWNQFDFLPGLSYLPACSESSAEIQNPQKSMASVIFQDPNKSEQVICVKKEESKVAGDSLREAEDNQKAAKEKNLRYNLKFKRVVQECLDGQKKDRNIESNTLKLFLRFVRTDLSKSCSLINRIIFEVYRENKKEQFLRQLDEAIHPSTNYVKVQVIRDICRGNQDFSFVFRVVFKKFFLEIIHLLGAKKARTNRVVRRDQIKAGRALLTKIFDD